MLLARQRRECCSESGPYSHSLMRGQICAEHLSITFCKFDCQIEFARFFEAPIGKNIFDLQIDSIPLIFSTCHFLEMINSEPIAACLHSSHVSIWQCTVIFEPVALFKYDFFLACPKGIVQCHIGGLMSNCFFLPESNLWTPTGAKLGLINESKTLFIFFFCFNYFCHYDTRC